MIGVWGVVLLLAAPTESVSVSLAEAIELALAHSPAVHAARLDVEKTEAQVTGARSPVLPSVDLSVRYVRNLAAPNPFAGSGADGVFGGLSSLGWLQLNEHARTDGDPNTNPLTLQEYLQRNGAGVRAAGGDPSGPDNVFLVENQLTAGITITQLLYDGAAFAGLRAAAAVRDMRAVAVRRTSLDVVNQTTQTYRGIQLAQAQVRVLDARIERVKDTLEDIRAKVARGVSPQIQQLTAEVELANIVTSRVQAQAQVEGLTDQLSRLLGLPPSQSLLLSDALKIDEPAALPTEDEALQTAYRDRPDLQQLQANGLAIDAQVDAANAGLWPRISAFANLQIQGSIPDDRTSTVIADPMGDPFVFRQDEAGVFDDRYWNKIANIGVQLTWNLFAGFSTDSQVSQARIDRRQVTVQVDALREGIVVEVRQALRALRTAQIRLDTQVRNIERAALAYDHATARLEHGVSTQADLRTASDQLDQSRFNHLQAIHDYLVAWTRLEVAMGHPPRLSGKGDTE